jgi:hypothetical protein
MNFLAIIIATTLKLNPRYSLNIRKMCQRMLWKANTIHDTTKLDSHINSYPTASENLNYTN